jgi:hypothetical protein
MAAVCDRWLFAVAFVRSLPFSGFTSATTLEMSLDAKDFPSSLSENLRGTRHLAQSVYDEGSRAGRTILKSFESSRVFIFLRRRPERALKSQQLVRIDEFWPKHHDRSDKGVSRLNAWLPIINPSLFYLAYSALPPPASPSSFGRQAAVQARTLSPIHGA